MLFPEPGHDAPPGWSRGSTLWVDLSPSVGTGLSKWWGIFPGHGQTEGWIAGSIHAVNNPVRSPMLLCPALGDLVVVYGIPASFEQHALAHIFAIVLHTMYLDSLASPLEATVRTSLMSDIFPLYEVLSCPPSRASPTTTVRLYWIGGGTVIYQPDHLDGAHPH